MEDHHIAAHRVAHHLRAIARLLPTLSAQPADIVHGLLSGTYPMTSVPEALLDFAEQVEQTAPFTPLTDEERKEVWSSVVDMCADDSPSDNAESITDGWTEADWRYEYDQMQAYMAEDDEVDPEAEKQLLAEREALFGPRP